MGIFSKVKVSVTYITHFFFVIIQEFMCYL